MSHGLESTGGGEGARVKMDLDLDAGTGSWTEGAGRAGDSEAPVCEEGYQSFELHGLVRDNLRQE